MTSGSSGGGCLISLRRLIGMLVLGWIGGMVLLVGLYVSYVQLRGVDTWDLRGPLAEWLTMDRWVDLTDLLPEGTLPEGDKSIRRLDTDGDGQKEWVVLYQYDRARARSPISVAIYDYDRGSPPVLYPYRLALPDRDYLSELANVTVEVGDFIKGDSTDKPELLVHGAGPPEEIAIFRFDETRKAAAWTDPQDYPQVYRCIGYFRADGYVKRPDADGNVVVMRRLVYDRAQLGVKEVYTYDAARDSYLQVDGKTMSGPKEQSIDFAFGPPSDLESTPYPEKVVLAYYQSLVNGGASSLMSAAGQSKAKTTVAGYGVNAAPEQLSRLLVQSIAYTPGSEDRPSITADGTTRTGAIVHVEFIYQVKGDPTWRSDSKNWFLVQERGRWRLDHTEP